MNQQSGYIKIDPSVADARFPSFFQGFNRRWFAGNCKAVYLCFTPAGTTLALDDAINLFGSNVKIKSGGHCYEDFVFNNSTGALIDVTPMAGYGYDEQRGYYLESGGTNWSAFQALFRDYGKVLPAGSCYSVGLGGHICGGGYGLLSRLNGLTVDWLTGVEVVVKDDAANSAYPVYVSADSTDQDLLNLYWSHCGGGGGNFGVITKYYFKNLPNAPKAALITSVAFKWDDLTEQILGELLQWYAEFSAGKDNWRQFGLFALNHRANDEIHLTIQTVVGYDEENETVLEQYITPHLIALKTIMPYRLMTRPGIAHLANLFQSSQHTIVYPFYEAVQVLNGSGPNQRGKYKSAYMRKLFPPDQVAAIYQWLNTVPDGLTLADMSQSLLQVDSYGGQVNMISPTDTAIPQRSSIMKLQYQTYWTDPADDQLFLQWINGFYQQVYQYTGGTPDADKDPTNNVDGCYYNYPDIDLNGPDNDKEIALKLYFGANLPRLKATKQRWDPNNYFNSSQSI
ncbi:MAG: hexose oxidase [Mucilaginibacter sp.]|nr:hexose oxidase [Mucilaginibacter sp.]